MSQAPVVPVQEAILDAAELAQLCFDIANAAELLAICERGPRGAAAISRPASAEGLAAMRADIESGALVAVQLRYRYQGQEWWDTLTRVPAGVRLLRISHTRALAAHEEGESS